MAYIVPSDITHLALFGSTAHELNTLSILKARLPDTYTVFHGVHWSRSYKGNTCYGEIDFVVVNIAGQVLLIEQKNGPLKETDQGLFKVYESSQKNVGDQLRRSLETVRENFKRQHRKETPLHLDYLIYCPDHNLTNLNAVGIDLERIIDGSNSDQLPDKIETILGPGSDEDPVRAELVQSFFRQTFDLVPNIHSHLSAQERTFTRLSGGLADVIDNIEMSPLRLRVKGTAGCGKSMVVHRLYEKALEQGRRPLLVCYSRPLRERLNAMVSDGGMVQTWNGLCDEFMKSRGHKFDYDQMKTDPNFWNDLAEKIIGETVPDDWLFETLIVDEGQDFDSSWFDILKLFLKPKSDIVWLEDQDQNLYGRGPVPLDGLIGYRSKTNYRSPESIARFIAKTLPFNFENANDLPGRGVGVEGYDNKEDQPKIVANIVNRLIKDGFDHSQIVVLTCRGIGHSIFSDLDRVGNLKLCRFTGEYDMFGNQILTDGKLYFESIYRYKGQQNPAVILVDVDPDPDKLDRYQRLLYCGMTRATVRLELVVNRNNDYYSRFRG